MQGVQRLSEEALTSVQDVESLVTRGTQLHACPYYATRRAVADAQVQSDSVLTCNTQTLTFFKTHTYIMCAYCT